MTDAFNPGLNFLIADDEELSRNYLKALISEFCPEGRLVASVPNITLAREALSEKQVDVVFLDIMMPGGDGFELLSSFGQDKAFKVVFVTAYNQHAIKAIKESAFDYILKPIDRDEFGSTMDRIKREHAVNLPLPGSTTPGSEGYHDQKLSIHHLNGFKLVAVKDIVSIQAANNYTVIKLASGEMITVSRPLRHFELSLSPAWFFRIHKSFIVNMHYISEYVSKEGGYVLMSTGDKIYASRYKLAPFFETMAKMTKGLRA